MTFREKIRQYHTLILALQEGAGKNREQLLSILRQAGMELSLRTFQRLLEELRDDFGIDISYDVSRNLYTLERMKDGRVLEEFLLFCAHNEWMDFVLQLMADGESGRGFVGFEKAGLPRGLHWLKTLYKAIREHLQVHFLLQLPDRKEGKDCIVQPYLLKEYQGKWYLVGALAKNGKIRAFDLSQVSQLEILQEPFKPDKDFPSEIILRYMIGISGFGQSPEKIILEFAAETGKALLAAPLHPTQKLLRENKDRVRLEYKLVVNEELAGALWDFGSQVEVLEPAPLGKELVRRSREVARIYK